MAVWGQTTVTLFPVQNYNFGEKPPNPSKDTSVEARIQRIQQQCVPCLASLHPRSPSGETLPAMELTGRAPCDGCG